MRLPKILIVAAFCFVFPFLIPGCGGKADDVNASVSAETLAAAAHGTYARYLKTHKAGEIQPTQEIPQSCWAKEIRALNPIRLYLHRVNVVVVQKASGDVEEGKYIYIPISSYIPQSGDDGFIFSNPCGPVWDFRRTVHD